MNLIKYSLIAALFTAAPITQANDDQPQSKKDIEAIVENYLLENPEIVVKAIQKWQQQQKLAQILPVLKTYSDYLFNDEGAPVLGNPEGSITLVEFYDYRCGYCKRHFPEVMRLLEANPDVKLVARQYPILDREGQKPLSKIASRAALAAHRQDKFEEFHMAMMQNPGSVTEDSIEAVARHVGLDIPKMRTDMRSSVIDKRITNSLIVGNELGLTGTPAYIVGTEVIVGAQGLDVLQEAIDKTKAKQAEKTSE